MVLLSCFEGSTSTGQNGVAVDLSKRSRTLLVALTTLVVSACAGAPSDKAPAAFHSQFDEATRVLTAGYAGIHEKYINDVPLNDVAAESIRGLATLDPALTIGFDDDKIILKRHGSQVASATMPNDDDPAAWATVTAALTRDASARSRDLRQASTEALYQAIFDGALSELDVYSRYAGAEEADRNRQSREGFGGIGIRFRMNNGVPVITEVTESGPAAREGLSVGDAIILIDGRPVVDLRLYDVTKRLRGTIRSAVEVKIKKPTGEPQTYVLTREHIIPPTVNASVDDGVLVIRVRSFNQGTAQGVANALEESARHEDIAGIILDLRGNPGGLLRQSIEVADAFLDHGDILDTDGRHPDSIQHYSASGQDSAVGKPIVVLIDGRSASAAEIVAAALQDAVRGVVIGTSSYGKGTVQTVIRLPNDGEMTLTWSRFLAPSGYAIHGLGVYPILCAPDIDAKRPAAILSAFEDQPTMAQKLDIWRQTAVDDLRQRRRLRADCPPESRTTDDHDMEIARVLIDDADLYSRALNVTTPAIPASTADARNRRLPAAAD